MRPYPISPRRPVPGSVARPPYVGVMGPEHYDGDDVQTPEVIEAMREAGRIAADAMAVAAAAIAPGVTTDHLDALGHAYMLDHGAYPATLGYRGFFLNGFYFEPYFRTGFPFRMGFRLMAGHWFAF